MALGSATESISQCAFIYRAVLNWCLLCADKWQVCCQSLKRDNEMLSCTTLIPDRKNIFDVRFFLQYCNKSIQNTFRIIRLFESTNLKGITRVFFVHVCIAVTFNRCRCMKPMGNAAHEVQPLLFVTTNSGVHASDRLNTSKQGAALSV